MVSAIRGLGAFCRQKLTTLRAGFDQLTQPKSIHMKIKTK